MKTKLLSRINALFVFLLGILGFTSCELRTKYGVPYAEIEVSGVVTDQENERLEDIRITVKQEGHQVLPRTYTNQAGWFDENGNIELPTNTVDIIVDDPSGVYAPDSIRLNITYDATKESKKNSWNQGKATIRQDFQLKKKE